MSSDYYLVCIDCKTGLLLGKSIHVKFPEYDVSSYGFSSIGSLKNIEENSYAIQTCEDLQHFMMLHRCHELRVLPSEADKFAKHVGVPHSFPVDDDAEPEYNRRLFFKSDTKVPDSKSETDALSEELIEKLNSF